MSHALSAPPQSSSLRPQSSWSVLLFRLLWLVAFPLEIAAGWLFFSSDRSLPLVLGALGLHLLASVIFAVSLITRSQGRLLWAWPLAGGTIALLAFPGYGMAAITLAFLLNQTLFRRFGPQAFDLARATDLEENPNDPVARAHEIEVALLDELEIEPVVDVLREDDPELKRAAIAVIAEQRNSESVKILVGLLHDPSPEARFFSSIGLSKLEDEISRTILAAQRSLAETPNSPEARENLARLYLDYATSGFLEGVTRDYYLDLARAAYESAIPISPHPEKLIPRLAHVHLFLGNIAEAASLLDDLVRRQPADLEVHLLRMEVIYLFGDYRELAIYAQKALAGLPDDAPERELIEWWASTGQRSQVGR